MRQYLVYTYLYVGGTAGPCGGPLPLRVSIADDKLESSTSTWNEGETAWRLKRYQPPTTYVLLI